MKTALVLQGGGTRCAYTAGVLEEIKNSKIKVDAIYGVSAAALCGMNFVSNQTERALPALYKCFSSKKFARPLNCLTHFSLLNYDVYFKGILEELPFDEKEFINSKIEFCANTTSVIDCSANYFYKSKVTLDNMYKAIRASASLSPLAKAVRINNIPYVDGGDADPVPYQKAIDDGYDKIIVVLTRPIDFRKIIYRGKFEIFLQNICYFFRPKFRKWSINESWKINNIQYDEITSLQNRLFVIAPSENIAIGSVEKDFKKYEYYKNLGIKDFNNRLKQLKKYLNQ